MNFNRSIDIEIIQSVEGPELEKVARQEDRKGRKKNLNLTWKWRTRSWPGRARRSPNQRPGNSHRGRKCHQSPRSQTANWRSPEKPFRPEKDDDFPETTHTPTERQRERERSRWLQIPASSEQKWVSRFGPFFVSPLANFYLHYILSK